jgi:ABC-type dipeptide/oligopeptide/nickel transport system permease component
LTTSLTHAVFGHVIFRPTCTVLGAHALAYALLRFLPEIGIAIFGIGAADPAVLERFSAQADAVHSYPDALLRLLKWNFGSTLDGVQVSTALQWSIGHSAPLIGIGLGWTALICCTMLCRPTFLRRPTVRSVTEFFSFLPAFVPAFVAFSVALFANTVALITPGWAQTVWLGCFSSVVPTCFALSTISAAFDVELRKPYLTTLRAFGWPETKINATIRNALLMELLPVIEKIATLQIATIIFLEVVFSYPGFGSSLLLATQRTDVNMVLGSTVAIAVAVAAVRILANGCAMILRPIADDSI